MRRLPVAELTVFSMLGAVMFVSKKMMEGIPNIHLLAMFIAAFTLTYRVKALIPLYVFILLDGIFAGFSMWWLPNVYIWLPLWGGFMLISRIKLPRKARAVVYMVVCGIHGLSFGVMYAPAQVLFFGLSFKATLAWIAAGVPFDIAHGIGNFAAASLVLPLTGLIKKITNAAKSQKTGCS